MRNVFFTITALAASAVLAQAPREAERPADPPATIARSMCDALAGAERDRCVAEQQADPQQRPTEPYGRPDARGACDHLIGPEKEICLKKGGSVKAGMGATGPAR
jgi:hypothetical protein